MLFGAKEREVSLEEFFFLELLAYILDYLQQLMQRETQTQNGSHTVLLPTENGLQRTTKLATHFAYQPRGNAKMSLSLHDAIRPRPSLSSPR